MRRVSNVFDASAGREGQGPRSLTACGGRSQLSVHHGAAHEILWGCLLLLFLCSECPISSKRTTVFSTSFFFFSSCFASKHTCQTYHKFVDEDVDVTLMNILSCLLPRLLLLCCHARFRFGATAPLSTPGATATPSRLRTAPLLLLLPRLLLPRLLPRRQNLKEPQLPSLTQAAAAAAAVHHLGCAPRARCFMKPP